MKSNTDLARQVFNGSREKFYEMWGKMSEEEAIEMIYEAKDMAESQIKIADGFFPILVDECHDFYRNKKKLHAMKDVIKDKMKLKEGEIEIDYKHGEVIVRKEW